MELYFYARAWKRIKIKILILLLLGLKLIPKYKYRVRQYCTKEIETIQTRTC